MRPLRVMAPAAEQLAGLLVHADAGVQVKDQDAAEAVKGDGAAALALSEADPQGHAVAGVCGAAVEQGGGHVEDASRTRGAWCRRPGAAACCSGR